MWLTPVAWYLAAVRGNAPIRSGQTIDLLLRRRPLGAALAPVHFDNLLDLPKRLTRFSRECKPNHATFLREISLALQSIRSRYTVFVTDDVRMTCPSAARVAAVGSPNDTPISCRRNPRFFRQITRTLMLSGGAVLDVITIDAASPSRHGGRLRN